MDWNSFVLGVLSSLVATFIVWVIKNAGKNRKQLALYGASIIKPNERIRISAAYLFRIKIDECYLLIRGRLIPSQFQPVGGVYKYFGGAKALLERLEVRSDENIKCKDRVHSDLRVTIPRKNIIKFLDWFDSRAYREISTQREFYEELVIPDYLGIDALTEFNPEFVRNCSRKLSYSSHFDMYELHIYDVYEVNLSESNKNKLKKYIDDAVLTESNLILVSEEAIRKETVKIHETFFAIAPTAKEIL